ncbi:MAG: hypothetical protein DHS20C17_36340 [Cyclobacteriaceae bacterium]|nr:MAG: hypothetical protein DHS20C17_36340 [Cyclobacteriaceae bacterium]
MKSLAQTHRFIIPIITTIMLLANQQASAQQEYPISRFGIRAGGNVNSWTNEFPSLEFQGTLVYPDAWKTHFGGHFGVYVNIRLSQLVGLEPGILYTQKGTGTTLDAGGFVAEGTINSNYLDLPLLLRLYVSDGFNIFLGPQFSYHLSSNYDLEVDGSKITSGEDTTDTISELDIAPVLGIGYEFPNGFNVNLSGELGMLTVDGIGNLSTYNRNIRLSVGYTF